MAGSILLALTSGSPLPPPATADPPSEVRVPQEHEKTLSERVYEEFKAIGQYAIDHPRTVVRDGALVVAVIGTGAAGIAVAAGSTVVAASFTAIATAATTVRTMVAAEAPAPAGPQPDQRA